MLTGLRRDMTMLPSFILSRFTRQYALIVISTFVFVVSTGRTVFAQENNTEPALFKTIPPPPNAAALALYGSIPVETSTGVPSIQIPLYTIQAGQELALPLSLSYHASGLKVEQRATFVGLGWSLNAGGAITRVIKGKPDEYGYSGAGDGNQIPTSAVSPSNYEQYERSALGTLDTQPDEFFYNFNGYSGKFVIGPNKEMHLLPYRNIKIEWIGTSSVTHFQVTTEDGTRYIFNVGESSTQYGCGSGDEPSYNSTWYLKTIILPKSKQTITFDYVEDPSLTITRATETRKRGNNPTSSPDCAGVNPVTSVCYSTTISWQKKISKISFPGGVVDFNYTHARTDLTNSNNQVFYALNSVDVKTSAGVFVKRYTMEYADRNGRMFLNAVNEVTTANGKMLSHKMSYIAGQLPVYEAKSQDHWGYYNGAGNATLVPGESGISGANRESDGAYASIGVLEKLEYPSGGYTTFEYEGNNYSYSSGGTVDVPIVQTVNDGFLLRTGKPQVGPPYPNYRIDSIVLNFPSPTSVQFNVFREACCGNFALAYIRHSNGTIENLPEGEYSRGFGAGVTYTIIGESMHEEPTATLERVNILISYQREVSRTRILAAGGLRIKKLITFDGLDHNRDIVKNYSYASSADPQRSSGFLLNKPIYNYSHNTIRVTATEHVECQQSVMTSAANNELEFSNGGVVKYTNVVEGVGVNNAGGTIKYDYEFTGDMASIGFPFTPAPRVMNAESLLRRKQTFDANGQLVEDVTTDYITIHQDTLQGWKTGFSVRYLTFSLRHLNVFKSNRYNYISTVTLPAKEKRLQFVGGTLSMADSTMYFYDNLRHIQPTRIRQATSDGREIWTHKKYIQDYTLPAGGALPASLEAIRFMQDEHLYAPVIEQYRQQVKQGATSTLSGNAFIYKKATAVSGSNALLDSVYTLSAGAPLTNFEPLSTGGGYLKKDLRYEPLLVFHAYDDQGNILQQAKANDANEVILWGYVRQYPVAKVIGSNYNTVAAMVDLNVLNSPVNDSQLRTELNKIRSGLANTGAQVFTYTFKPMVGMTSATDSKNMTTYYEYDELGRLQLVRDGNNNIIKMICYDVNGQVYDCGGRSTQ